MSVSTASVSSQDGGPLSPAKTRFVTSFFHVLKGWCYLPAGVLLAGGTLMVALLQPTWLETIWVPFGLAAGSILLTAPWAYVMHRHYRQAYGQVTGADEGIGSPLGGGDVSLAGWMVYMLGMLSWIAVLMLYIPQELGYDDNHILFFVAALPLARGLLSAPALQHRLVYAGAVLLLIAATLTPLLGWSVVVVQAVCYTTLGTVAAGIGAYNHRLLVDTLGPLAAGEGRDE
ncbi:MAG TPA: hypothetical protein VJ884_08415 [Salinibacter sp.]|nr:hypothetical protein [Salinibacter sp.]